MENGKLPFLDCLVSRDNNELRTTVYRKPTHTDRLLDQSSYNPTSHKATTIKTLTRRAQLVCDTPDSLRDENRYLERVFHKNNYNADFIRRNIYRPTEAARVRQFAFRSLSPGRKIVVFKAKYAVPRRLKDRIVELNIRKRQSNFRLSLFFVSCEEKYCYRVVSVGQLGLTAARTAGTATVELNKSFFRSFFLVLSWEV